MMMHISIPPFILFSHPHKQKKPNRLRWDARLYQPSSQSIEHFLPMNFLIIADIAKHPNTTLPYREWGVKGNC
jgi:hypothetical protein